MGRKEKGLIRAVSFLCHGIKLEGLLHLPSGPGPFSAVVVCHPHPLYGGDMDNTVVRHIAIALQERAIASLRFNFRGVGASEGSFGGGRGEQEDVKAALDRVAAQPGVGGRRLGLAGYSFGAGAALAVAATESRVRALALISPPRPNTRENTALGVPKPMLIISGAADDLVPAEQVKQLFQELPEPKELQLIEGVDHFWLGYEEELAVQVAGFFMKHLAAE